MRARQLAHRAPDGAPGRPGLAGPADGASRGGPELTEVSPCEGIAISQDLFESVLRERLQEVAPGALRTGIEVQSATWAADGVRTTLLDRNTGDSIDLDSRYLAAADGWRSALRTGLGIELDGPDQLGTARAVTFRSDLRPWLGDPPPALVNLGGGSVLIAHARRSPLGGQRAAPARSARSPGRPGPDHPRAAGPGGGGAHRLDLDRRRADRPPVQRGTRLPGRGRGASGAARRRDRRQFGHGRRAQSRLEDRRGLRRLGASGPARHVRGGAPRRGPDHDPGRARPVALHDVAGQCGPDCRPENRGHGLSVRLGRRGRRVPGRTLRRSVRPFGRARGSGPARLAGRRPGRRSTIDLFGRGFVLLAGSGGSVWSGAAAEVAAATGVPVAETILTDPHAAAAYAITGTTAVLVRPDGHVAGRLEPGRTSRVRWRREPS